MNDYPIRLDENTVSMSDAVAFFITWPTYGTWLPGDKRGWVDIRQGWKLPQPQLELECASRMTEDACRLGERARIAVEAQVKETCQHRGWQLYAVSCRSNHAHIVVAAVETDPKRIRADIKAWCARRLKEKIDAHRDNWWADRGSVRWVWHEQSLLRAVEYTTDSQDIKSSDR